MQDDAKQSPKATALIESLTPDQPGFVSLVTVVELYWVLTGCYQLSHEQVRQAPDALLRTRQLVVDRADQVLQALRIWHKGKADFADCLITSATVLAGCERVMTFDQGAIKHAGMTPVA